MTHLNRQPTFWKIPRILMWATTGICVLAIGVRAQEAGSLATLGLSFGGEYRLNDPDADRRRLSTDLSFEYSRNTRNQNFGLSLGGQLLYDDQGDEDLIAGFENPSIGLDYSLSNRSTLIGVDAAYSSREIDGEIDLIDPLTLNVLDVIEDDGTLETFRLGARLETGRDARFGTSSQFSYTSQSYAGTSDPDLTDQEVWRANTRLRFDIHPGFIANATASFVNTDEDDAENTDQRNVQFGIGADLIFDRLWSGAVELNYSQIETRQDNAMGVRELTTTDGVGFSIAVDRQFRNGTLGLTYSRETTELGPEDRITLSRNTALSNGGTLAWSLGLVSFATGDTAPLASVSYEQPTRSGNFAVNFQQSGAVDSDDRSTVRTALNASYNSQINAVSGWSLDGSLSSNNIISGDADDTLDASIGVSYNRTLTRDWDFSTQLRQEVSYEGGDRDESAQILSFTLQRSFTFRP